MQRYWRIVLIISHIMTAYSDVFIFLLSSHVLYFGSNGRGREGNGKGTERKDREGERNKRFMISWAD